MIVNFNNKSCLIVDQLKDLGPEPHYKCLINNEEIILAKQTSGIFVRFHEEKTTIFDNFNFKPYKETFRFYSLKEGFYHREDNLPALEVVIKKTFRYFENNILHRLNGPAYVVGNSSEDSKYYIDGIEISEDIYEKAIFLYKENKEIFKNSLEQLKNITKEEVLKDFLKEYKNDNTV